MRHRKQEDGREVFGGFGHAASIEAGAVAIVCTPRKELDVVTSAEMRAWVKPIVDAIPRDDDDQKRFAFNAQGDLMNALGRKSQFVGLSVAQVLDRAAAAVG